MPKPPILDHALYTMASENLYTLSVLPSTRQTTIVMKLLIPQVNTRDFPHTTEQLKVALPSIFRSMCYNDERLTFEQEVKQTEVGHLFEHILLEYLCLLKLERGFISATYEGVTNWNWVRDPRGTFHITIKATKKDYALFSDALQKTITLMNTILVQNISYALSTEPQIQKQLS